MRSLDIAAVDGPPAGNDPVPRAAPLLEDLLLHAPAVGAGRLLVAQEAVTAQTRR
jgi:hypothetical protein